MGLKLQNVAGRIVVLKFQEELAKRRQEVAARPKATATPTPQYRPTPAPVPVPGVSEAQLQARAGMPQLGVPNPLDLLKNQSLLAGLKNAAGVMPMPSGVPARSVVPVVQSALPAANAVLGPYQRHINEPLAGALWTGIRQVAHQGMWQPIGMPPKTYGPEVEIPTSWSGMRQQYEEAPSALKLPLLLASDPMNLLPFAPAALRKAGTLAETVLPEARAAAARYVERSVPIGASRGYYGEPLAEEVSGLKLPSLPSRAPPEPLKEGQHFVAPLRPFEEVEAEVATTDNPLVKAALAKTGIIPSVAATDPVAKAIVVNSRQEIASEELTKTALSASLDRYIQPVTGRQTVLDLDEIGRIKNISTREGQSRMWNDVFSRPDDYNLTTQQRALIDDYNTVIEEAEAMRVGAGLRPLSTTGPDGWHYVPRQVETVRGVELRRPSNPRLQRVYEEAEAGAEAGVNYSKDFRANLEIHLRSAYREVAQKQLADATMPYSITPSKLVPQPIVTRMEEAVAIRQDAERLLRRTQRSATWWKAGAKWRTKLTTATAGKTALREPDLAAAKARLDAAAKDIDQLEGKIQYRRGRASVPSPNIKDEKQLTFLRQWKQDMETNIKEWQSVQTTTEKAAKLRVIERDMAKWDARAGELKENVLLAQDARDATMVEYKAAKNAYSRAMESARHKEIASGKFWGPDQPDTIPIAMWRNRYFRLEDAEKLVENLGGLGVKPRQAGMIGKGFEQTGNVVRFGASVGDFATPFVQNLPVLARNPARWAKATAIHYYAFLDPTEQARYIANHLETFQKLARNGVPIGDPEFFKALERGQMPSLGKPLELVPKVGKATRQVLRSVGKQTFGRFQSSYNVNLGIGRAEIWESLEGGWKTGEGELAAYIRNLTGGLDTRALGVGPERRALESTWAAFSPRLLRSTVALVGDALKTPAKLLVGQMPSQRELESARTLFQLAGGVTGIYVLVGIGLGKTREEITQGLNPLGGKKFLSYQIGGDWIGIGGQVRALVQLAAGFGAGLGDPIRDISEGKRPTTGLTSVSIYDNPVLAFYSSRGAMGTKISGAAIEALTGGKLDTLPYDNVDSPAKFAQSIAMAALPFTLQGILQGEKPLTSALSMVGARTQAESSTEKRERIALEETGTAYGAMKPQQREDFRAAHPDLYAGPEDYPKGSSQRRVIEIREDTNTKLGALGEQLEAGKIDGQEYIDGRADILTEGAILSAEYRSDYESDNPYDQAYSEWQEMIAVAKEANPAGVLTGAAFSDLERQAEKQLGHERWAMVQENRLASADPVEKRYLEDRAKMEAYWELTDTEWQAFCNRVPRARAYVGMTYEQYRASVTERLRAEGKGEGWVDRDPLILLFEKATGQKREVFLYRNPEVDALRAVWGYQRTVHTKKAADIYKARTGLQARPPAQ